MCEFRLVLIAIFVCCELGGEMAFCYHLGRIYFRNLGARSPVHFQLGAYREKKIAIANMVSIQVSNLFTNWCLHTLTKDMADKHSFGSGVSVHFLSSGALKTKGKLDKVVWDRFYALRKKLWTAVWSVNPGWIMCTPKECKLTIFKPYAEKFNISVPDHFPA